MKIIGGKDYYDSCMGLGQYDSNDIMFIRKNCAPTEYEIFDTFVGDRSYTNSFKGSCGFTYSLSFNTLRMRDDSDKSRYGKSTILFEYINEVRIFFCGKAYAGYEIGGEFIWSKEKLLSLINQFHLNQTYSSFGVCIGYIPELDRRATEYLDKFKCAIALCYYDARSHKHYVEHDTYNLKKYNFQSVVDPYTAYQELSMWIGSRARPEKPMIKVSNEILIKKHGFDKHSFRKEKKVQ